MVREGEDGRRLSMLRWGLIPGWAKEPNVGYRLINARSETVSAQPAFRAAWAARRRCLIPADGFHEWTRSGAARQPWLIGMKDGVLFAFAGLWERWTVREGMALKGALSEFGSGDAVETCVIPAIVANEAMAPIHHRMPVILPPALFDPWLAGEAVALDPYRDDRRARQHPRQQAVERRSALYRACDPLVGRRVLWHASLPVMMPECRAGTPVVREG